MATESAPSKPTSLRSLICRVFLVGVLVFVLRFVYVVTIHGERCDAGDFCFFSLPEGGLTLPGAAASAGAAKPAFVRGSGDRNPAWSSREWRKAVGFHSAVFQDLIAEGFLSPASKSLCVETPLGQEVFALKEIGVSDAVGLSKKKSLPLVVAGDVFRQPFGNDTFHFVFSGTIERSKRPADLAAEIARTLKPEGFLAVHTLSAGDLYSFNSFLALFDGFRFVRKREISGLDSSSTIREIVLQKMQGFRSSGNPANKCSGPEYKLKLLNSAEPLIGEEPLKPWITLKKNAKNIKYLPSMADISFKRRYLYVDVGARSYGSSIGSWFKKQYPKQNQTFEVYAIEADRAFHAEYAMKKGVNLLPYAAWIRNETLSFEINHYPDQKHQTTVRGMGRIRPAGATSGDVHTIPGFDFAGWLKSMTTEKDFVVMKMDVEGTEFDLIPRLFETGAICLIDELFLECHYNRWQRCCPGVRTPKYQNTYGQCLELFDSLRKNGVLVHQWW